MSYRRKRIITKDQYLMLIAELENTDNWKPDYAALSRKTGIPSYCIEPRYRRLRNLDAIIPSIKLKVTKEALDYQTALRDRKIKHKKNGKKNATRNTNKRGNE